MIKELQSRKKAKQPSEAFMLTHLSELFKEVMFLFSLFRSLTCLMLYKTKTKPIDTPCL